MDQMTEEEVTNIIREEWMERLKREFLYGRLASNVVFTLIMAVLERLVQTEFECPCKGTYYLNAWFVATFFFIPMILAMVLMASLQRPKSSCHCWVPAFVWMILLVFDGRYIACAMTDWSGRYVTADKAAPLKWCEPEDGTSYQDRLKSSQTWHAFSQWAGLCLVLVLPLIINCIKDKSPAQGQLSIHALPGVPLQRLPASTPHITVVE
ncbi:collagen type II alpha [Sarotherodon galilaeus]